MVVKFSRIPKKQYEILTFVKIKKKLDKKLEDGSGKPKLRFDYLNMFTRN